MKIVIDIDEDMLTEEEIEECIKLAKTDFSNVSILPKGHGDLIDLNYLEEMKEPVYTSGGDMCGYGVIMKDIREYVEPIVSADKGE